MTVSSPTMHSSDSSLARDLDGDTPGTLTASLAHRLRLAILQGEFAPGARLRLEGLRHRYEVSLSPLREALTRLGAEGLVEMTDQKGYRVAPISADNLREVTVLRITLEQLALCESLRRGGDEWEDAVVAAYHRLSRLEASGPEGSTRLEGWEKAHRTFHLALFSACGMPILLKFCNTLHDMSDRYRRLFFANHQPDRDVPAEHKALFDAALARDEARAAEVLRHHLERTGNNLLAILSDDA